MLKFWKNLPFIDEIYLLNLPRRVDRLEFQIKQFSNYFISPFTRVEPTEVQDSCNFLDKSVRSIYLSHLKIIKKAIENKTTVLILEDDVVIKNFYKVKESINFLFTKINDWDMFYFYNLSVDGFATKEILEDNIIRQFGDLCKIKRCLELHAYIINKNKLSFVYDILIKNKDKIENSEKQWDYKCHIDQVLMSDVHPKINVYGTATNLIVQDRKKFGSDNRWT